MALVQSCDGVPRRPADRRRRHIALALVEGRGDQITFISADPAFKITIGARSALAGRRLDQLCAEQDAPRLQSLIGRCLTTGVSGRIEGVFASKGEPAGRRAWVLPVGWADGDARQAILAVSAIGPAYRLTAENEALFDQLGSISAGMLYIYDVEQQRTRYIHPHLAEVLGLAPDGASLTDVQERLHPADLEVLGRHIADMVGLKDHEVAEAKVRLRGRDGEWRVIRSQARVFARSRAGAVRRVIGVASDVTEALAQTQALAAARETLSRAEAEERRRIGRELHDSTAQHLLAIRLSLAALERQVKFSQEHQPVLRDIRESLAAAHQEIRAFSFALHPPGADGRRLVERLRAFAEGFGRRTALSVSVKVEGHERAAAPASETALFRICQEALMNVHRHTAARNVRVVLSYRDERVALEVEDDGGVLEENALASLEGEAGVGVRSMRDTPERISAMISSHLGRKVAGESRSFAAEEGAAGSGPSLFS